MRWTTHQVGAVGLALILKLPAAGILAAALCGILPDLIDQRIAACMPSCAFTSFYASIGVRAHGFCNYIPGIARDFDMGDLCAMIAPRPLVIIAGAKDTSFPLKEAKEQFEITRRLYERLAAPDRCRLIAAPEGPRYYADLAWPAFREAARW